MTKTLSETVERAKITMTVEQHALATCVGATVGVAVDAAQPKLQNCCSYSNKR